MAEMTGERTNPLLQRLRHCSDLTGSDEEFVLALTQNVRTFERGEDIKSEGENPQAVHVVLSGLACRYKLLEDGRRQIVAFLVPGDPCDWGVFLLDRMNHSIGALCTTEVAVISRELVSEAFERPGLLRAFWASTLLDESVLREWIVNIGRRDARERVAHLLWELYLRHVIVGRADGLRFPLTLTQTELADSLGLTNVYVNKVLQRLRVEGTIEMNRRHLTILDPGALQQLSRFESDYLKICSKSLAERLAGQRRAS